MTVHYEHYEHTQLYGLNRVKKMTVLHVASWVDTDVSRAHGASIFSATKLRTGRRRNFATLKMKEACSSETSV
jgi:hypothetical protein